MPPSSSPSDGAGQPGLFDEVVARGAVRGMVADAAWLRAMLRAEAALAVAGAEAGLFPQSDAEQIADACREGDFDVTALGAEAAGAGNPVVPLVRALTEQVRSRAGDQAAGVVHLGATSQDIMDTATVLVARDAIGAITADLELAAGTAAGLAREHATTPMAGRTLLQQALPITFGLKAAGWLAALDQAADGLRSAAARLPAQLGGAAGTLASLGEQGPAVLAAFCRLLELPEPVLPWHTARVPLAELAGALGVAAGVIGKVALDVVLLAQTEVAEASESAPGRGGSSTLPHKRNPIAAVCAVAGARQAPGLVATLLGAMAQEHERAAGAWHAEWRPLRELLVSAGSAASWVAESLATLRVDADRMRAGLELTHGLLLAERVAGALQPALGRLRAGDLVEEACRRAVAEDRELAGVLLEHPEVAATLGRDEVVALLDPAGYLGSSGMFVERALRRHEDRRP